MRNKKRTDDEVKKALECHSQNDTCAGCVYWDGKLACTVALAKDTLDLIKRLQAENERLSTLAELCNTRANDYRVMRDRALKAEAENERLQLLFESVINSRDGYIKVIEQYKAENERLRENNKAIMQTIADVHTEAIKEFAEWIYSLFPTENSEIVVISRTGIAKKVNELVGDK